MNRRPVFSHQTLWLLMASALLYGCAVGPDYVRPEAPVSAEFKPAPGWKIAAPEDDIVKGEWWKIYHDPVLNDLMAKIEPNNQNVALYVARVRQAQAQASSASAARYPSLSFSGQGGRTGSAGSGNLINPADGTIDNGNLTNAVNFQLGLSWDADIWGKLRRNVESKDAAFVASVADLENARLSMQSQLAQSYFTIRSLDSLSVLYKDTTAQNKKSVDITRNNFEVGVKAKQDLINATMQYRSTEARMVAVQANRAAQEAIIATLIGQPASDFSLAFNPLPGRADLIVPVVPAGLPSQLLERRPDIGAAERRMAAANAQIGYQKAAYFPSLTLSPSGLPGTNFGYQGTSFSQLFSAPFLFWGIGPNIAMTVLDFGTRAANVEQARGAYDESVATYRQTVLTAIQEVETQLATLRVKENEATAQDEAADMADRAVVISMNRYNAGIDNYTNVVVAVNQALSNRERSIQIANERLTASVLLVKSIGGSWQDSSTPDRQQQQNSAQQQTHQRPGG